MSSSQVKMNDKIISPNLYKNVIKTNKCRFKKACSEKKCKYIELPSRCPIYRKYQNEIRENRSMGTW